MRETVQAMAARPPSGASVALASSLPPHAARRLDVLARIERRRQASCFLPAATGATDVVSGKKAS
jgi:hypothetical protein